MRRRQAHTLCVHDARVIAHGLTSPNRIQSILFHCCFRLGPFPHPGPFLCATRPCLCNLKGHIRVGCTIQVHRFEVSSCDHVHCELLMHRLNEVERLQVETLHLNADAAVRWRNGRASCLERATPPRAVRQERLLPVQKGCTNNVAIHFARRMHGMRSKCSVYLCKLVAFHLFQRHFSRCHQHFVHLATQNGIKQRSFECSQGVQVTQVFGDCECPAALKCTHITTYTCKQLRDLV